MIRQKEIYIVDFVQAMFKKKNKRRTYECLVCTSKSEIFV